MLLKAILFLLASWPAWSATYYIANGGSDSAAGTKEAPWAHMPGMPTCTGVAAGTCGGTTPAAGDSFILKGGDTWGYADLGVNWRWSGSEGSPIYIGVDVTWYTGGSWARPIFTCNGRACAQGTGYYSDGCVQIDILNGYGGAAPGYVTVDNIEFKGAFNCGSLNAYGVQLELKNNYFHGWSHDTNGDDSKTKIVSIASTQDYTESNVHDNLIDGSDTARDSAQCIYGGYRVYNNVTRYCVGHIQGPIYSLHDNLMEYAVKSYQAGDPWQVHPDFYYGFGAPLYGDTTHNFAYNNVLRHAISDPDAAMGLWLTEGGCAGCTTYAFNNVIYDGNSAWAVASGGYRDGEAYGTFYVFNNTAYNGGSYFTGMEGTTSTATTHYGNNHASVASDVYECQNAGGVTCTDDGGNLFPTAAAMTAGGYASSQAWPYSPSNGASATVRQGANQQALCSTIAAIDSAAGSACRYDTPLGPAESGHAVAGLKRVPVARPLSGAWDTGAYQFMAPSFGGSFGGTMR